jgi:hypothetical protein
MALEISIVFLVCIYVSKELGFESVSPHSNIEVILYQDVALSFLEYTPKPMVPDSMISPTMMGLSTHV